MTPAENEYTCPSCKQSKPLSAFTRRDNRVRRKTCEECRINPPAAQPIVCIHCNVSRRRQEYTNYRLKQGIRVCTRCDPPTKGPRSQRTADPHRTYPCKKCERELPADWFYVETGSNGRQFVRGVCRRCRREEIYAKRSPILSKDEAELRNDVLYDFDLARNMFGFSYREACDWLIRGYVRDKVDEEKLEQWGITQNRKILWEPDEYKEGGEID